MKFKDFRDYLDALEKQGMLLRVKKEVDVKHEIAAGIRKISDNDGPALLFENVKGYPGWKVAGGIFGTKRLMAYALQTEPKEDKLVERYLEFDQKRIKPRLVSTGPCKEVIIKGDDVDVTKLPNCTYCEKDSGPVIVPVDICRHPATGVQNASIVVRKVWGKDRTWVASLPPRHEGQIVVAHEEQGHGAPIAAVIGAPVEVQIASQLKPPLGVDEMEIAGALRGEPIEMVKCETIDVEVPASAEIIIEGVTIPGERFNGGPFGEFPGDYFSLYGQTGGDGFALKVTAITMRKEPIYQAMLTGMPLTENHWIKNWAVAAECYRIISRLAPYPEYIKGICPAGGGTGYSFVVSIRKWSETAPAKIIYTILSANLVISNVIVVDDDINPYDCYDVARALTRVRAPKDIYLPSGIGVPGMGFQSSKWGIDATAPLTNREWFVKAVPPGVDKVDYV